MNGGAATAFLPKFAGFPSLRGLHSSTVQPQRAPVPGRRAPVRPAPRPEPGRTGARNVHPIHERTLRRAQLPERHQGGPELSYRREALSGSPCGRPTGVRRVLRPGSPGHDNAGPAPRCGPRVRWIRPPCREVGRRPRSWTTDGRREQADVSQLPPPPQPPPPPQDDPPPQDEPLLQDELLLQECPPLCPPESPPPAHQLLLLLLEPEDAHAPRRAVRRERDPPLRAVETRAPTRTTPTTARMMPTIMASPSFRFPRSGPPWAPRSCVRR